MKAAIYVRLSEEDKNKSDPATDSRSIINQKELLKSYASERGWEIYDVYSDDDYTGSDRKRPQFQRLIADARQGCFDIVLCKTLSRFTRELELVEKYIHGLFPLWGIRFISVADNQDSFDKRSKKARQISGLINEWYLEDMSDSIKAVLCDKRKKGKHIGAFAPYGYIKDKGTKGKLIPDRGCADTVKLIFKLYDEGHTMTDIAKHLNGLCIPSPSEYKRKKGEKYKCSQKHTPKWKYPAVSFILRNEMYAGNMVQGRFASSSYKTKKKVCVAREEWYVVKDTHAPLVEKELWDRVQKKLSLNKKKKAKNVSHSSRAESTSHLRQHSEVDR